MSNSNKPSSKLQKLDQVQVQSPRFGGGATAKAGKYGQSPYQFIQESKSHPHHEITTGITHKQLEKHGTLNSAWISLKGVVYDVTAYMKHHPGGNILLEGCGKESSQLFNQYHSWVNAKNILSNCVIGHLQNH